MAVTIVPTGFEGFGDSFSSGIERGFMARMEKDLKEKELEKKAKLDIGDLATIALFESSGVLPDGSKNAYLNQFNELSNQATQATGVPAQAGGIQPPNMQPMTVNQIQGLPRVGLNDVLMNKQFGYQTDPMVAREFAIEQQKKQMEFNLKEQEKIRSKSVEAEMLSPTFKAIVDDYKGAVDEIKANAPDALKTGFEGYLGRVGLKLGSSQFIDEFPKAAALVDNIKADATSIAKAAGEQRPTDEDIYRFTSILLNPTTRSLNTNIAKLESLNKRWKGQGLNTDWTKPYLDYLKNTAKEVSGKKIKIGNEEVTIRLKE